MVKLLISFLLLISILSCQGQKASDRDPLSDSYQKIDSGDYDGAIAKLEELHSKDQGPQIKMALASAYAARAGLKIEKLWNFVKALEAPRLTEDSVQKNTLYLQMQELIEKNKILLNAKSQADLRAATKAIIAFEDYRQRIETLPYIEQSKRMDLEKASEVLKGAGTKGARLYRAIINLVFLRSSLTDGAKYWSDMGIELKKLNTENPKSARNKNILNAVCITGLQKWANSQIDQLQEISQDVGFAFPSKYSDLTEFDKNLEKYHQEISTNDVSRTLTAEVCPEN